MKIMQIVRLNKGDLIYCPLLQKEYTIMFHDRKKQIIIVGENNSPRAFAIKHHLSFFYACFKGSKKDYESDICNWQIMGYLCPFRFCFICYYLLFFILCYQWNKALGICFKKWKIKNGINKKRKQSYKQDACSFKKKLG